MITDPLISAALLGTARMAAMPPPPDASMENTWKAISLDDSADAVLQALALTRALHRGGAKLQKVDEATPSCTLEIKELLSSGAVDSLMRLLKGEFSEVLSEWLDFASTSGRVLPGRVFPELLAAATKDHSLRPTVRLLAGERGKWIVSRYPKFAWLADHEKLDDSSWEEGPAVERIAWLEQTRAMDPARAMQAVASHWSGEDAAMRESILRLMAGNPLPSEESWLEHHALNDRRQEIRELAGIGLGLLPDSGFRKRALGRIRGQVKIQRRLLKRVISVEPPGAFDPSWAADGLKEKPPQGTGEKAWWLRQMTGQLPLDEWPDLLGCDAGECFGFPIDRDWQEPVLLGWIDAARRFPHRSMAERFISFLSALDPWPAAAVPRVAVLASMLDVLPAKPRYALLDVLVGKLPIATAIDLLTRCGGPPPPGMGKAALSAIDTALASTPAVFNRPQARSLALCIPQEGILARLEMLAKLPELSPAAEEFATTLEFRRSLPTHFNLP